MLDQRPAGRNIFVIGPIFDRIVSVQSGREIELGWPAMEDDRRACVRHDQPPLRETPNRSREIAFESAAAELEKLDCEYAQGYAFGEPMTADEAMRLVAPELPPEKRAKAS